MSRRRRKNKTKVYYNSDTDTWSNDSGEQPYLMPGTEAYAAYQQALNNQFGEGKSEDEFHKQYTANLEDEKDKLLESQKPDESLELSGRKFRLRRSKERQNKELEKTIEDGLDINVDIDATSKDEVYDDGISEEEYAKTVVKDYKKIIESVPREVPTFDKNGDGKVDEADVDSNIITPGRKKLMSML